MTYRKCSGGGVDPEVFNAVLIFEDLHRGFGNTPFQVVEIQCLQYRRYAGANQARGLFKGRFLLAFELLDYWLTMIISEGNIPLWHQSLLDKTHGWAYIYLDLEGLEIVPIKAGGT